MRSLPTLLVVATLAGCAHTASPPRTEPAAVPSPPPAVAPVERNPQAGMTRANAGMDLLEQKGDPATALTMLEEAWALGFEHEMVAYYAANAASMAGRKNAAVQWLELAVQRGFDDPGALRTDPGLAGIRAERRVTTLIEKLEAAAAERLAKANPGSGLERSTPEAEGVDVAALKELVAAAEAAGTSGLVVVRNGKLVGEWYFGSSRSPIEAMSATKSVVSLAVGLLLQDGLLKSIDEPVSTFFPVWNTGDRAKVTVRHLLNHTSGLHADPTTERIYASPDFVMHALESEVAEPGARFFYNNSAVNLLAGVVGVAAKQRMDLYLNARLFAPLGITDVTWSLDRAGNPHGMSGLQIHPADFAKLGQMLLDGGRWQGKRVLDSRWIAESARGPGQKFHPMCGLLWWLAAKDVFFEFDAAMFQQLADHQVDPAVVQKLSPLRGKRVRAKELEATLTSLLGPEGDRVFFKALHAARLLPPRTVEGGYEGFSAVGYLGQRLVVFPEKKLVVVRMARAGGEVSEEALEFDAFNGLVRKLIP